MLFQGNDALIPGHARPCWVTRLRESVLGHMLQVFQMMHKPFSSLTGHLVIGSKSNINCYISKGVEAKADILQGLEIAVEKSEAACHLCQDQWYWVLWQRHSVQEQ